MHYVDGRGWLSGGSREAMYCPSCRSSLSGVASSYAASAASAASPVQPQAPDAHVVSLPSRDFYRPSVNNSTWKHSVPPLSEATPLSADDSLSSSTVCKICLDAPPNALFLPCAHLVSCAACTESLFGRYEMSRMEITGRDLVARTSLFGNMAQLGLHQSAFQCPLCRTGVRRWMKVYMT